MRSEQPADAGAAPALDPQPISRHELSTASRPISPVGDLIGAAWQRTCFYSSPIGEAGSEVRRHADAFLDVLVQPAIQAVDPEMRVIRADDLSSSLISAGVFEHVVNARLLVADLSFHNPNVLHEVGFREAHKRPFVLISRDEDPIPSNLRDVRTVLISTKIWEFMDHQDMYRERIESYARWVLSRGSE